MKKSITNDHRYDAVGSSSLREELFNTFLKAQQSPSKESLEDVGSSQTDQGEVDPAEKERLRKERKERAVREREERVKTERNKLEAQIDRTRTGLNKEEGEREFRCAPYLSEYCWGRWAPLIDGSYFLRTMLVDAIRDPQVRLQLVSERVLIASTV